MMRPIASRMQTKTIDRAGRLHDAWGKPNKTDEWRAKLAESEAASGE